MLEKLKLKGSIDGEGAHSAVRFLGLACEMTLSKVTQRVQISIVIVVFLANAGVSAATDGQANRNNCHPGLRFNLHVNGHR